MHRLVNLDIDEMGAEAQDSQKSRLAADMKETTIGAVVTDVKTVVKPEASPKTRFPEHLSGQRVKPTWKETIYGFGKHNSWKIKCEHHVVSVLRNSAPVKLLSEALKSVGW